MLSMLWSRPGVALWRLENANDTRLTLTGQDDFTDATHHQPKNIIVRFSLAAQDLSYGSVFVHEALCDTTATLYSYTKLQDGTKFPVQF